MDFEECLKIFTGNAEIDFVCSQCKHPRATLTNGFITLPDVLVVAASRFVLKNWVPTKLGIPYNYKSDIDVPIVLPQNPISLDQYLVPRGLQPGEIALPDDSPPSLPPLDEAAFAQLQAMGFPANRAEKALRVTGNSDAQTAMEWLFAHLDDPDIDIPYQMQNTVTVDPESINNLAAMGFDERIVRKALQETVAPS